MVTMKLQSGTATPKKARGARNTPLVRHPKENPPRHRPVPGTAARPKALREPSPSSEVATEGDPDPKGNPDPVVFHRQGEGDELTKKLTNAADMSGSDCEGPAVAMSMNWNCDFSADRGANWKRLDPSAVFPNPPDFPAFDCDQVVIYVPSIDRFVWFMQHKNAKSDGQGAFRLAVASASSVQNDPTAWTYWDFRAGDFGYPTSNMDFPDLSFSETNLYVSTDIMDPANGRIVLRIPLQELQAGGSLHYQFTDPTQSTGAMLSHFAQQTTSRAVWFAHDDNTTMRIWTLPDSGSTYSSFTVKVAGWPNGTLSSMGPDGNDWLTKLDSLSTFAVTGAVQRANGNIVVSWTASSGKATGNGFDFPQAHCRVVEVDMGTRKVVSEMQVWNPDYAFAYPNLAVNARDEVGIILGWGGSTDHANCAMGILGDFVVWFRTGSTRTVQRFGDFLTTRPSGSNRSRYSAFGYTVTDDPADNSKCRYHPFYTQYGRAST